MDRPQFEADLPLSEQRQPAKAMGAPLHWMAGSSLQEGHLRGTCSSG